jgi:hypothetical protein
MELAEHWDNITLPYGLSQDVSAPSISSFSCVCKHMWTPKEVAVSSEPNTERTVVEESLYDTLLSLGADENIRNRTHNEIKYEIV